MSFGQNVVCGVDAIKGGCGVVDIDILDGRKVTLEGRWRGLDWELKIDLWLRLNEDWVCVCQSDGRASLDGARVSIYVSCRDV